MARRRHQNTAEEWRDIIAGWTQSRVNDGMSARQISNIVDDYVHAMMDIQQELGMSPHEAYGVVMDGVERPARAVRAAPTHVVANRRRRVSRNSRRRRTSRR